MAKKKKEKVEKVVKEVKEENVVVSENINGIEIPKDNITTK